MQKKPQKPPTIKDLYLDLSPEEQAEAEYRLKAYLALCWKIFNRLKSEGRLNEITHAHLREQWEKRGKGKE